MKVQFHNGKGMLVGGIVATQTLIPKLKILQSLQTARTPPLKLDNNTKFCHIMYLAHSISKDVKI